MATYSTKDVTDAFREGAQFAANFLADRYPQMDSDTQTRKDLGVAISLYLNPLNTRPA